jgi:hypothetical protein
VKHLVLFLAVALLAAVGLVALARGADADGHLHQTNAVLGGGALLLAVALALPARMKTAVATLLELAQVVRGA